MEYVGDLQVHNQDPIIYWAIAHGRQWFGGVNYSFSQWARWEG